MDLADFPVLLSQHARLVELHTALPGTLLAVETMHGTEAVSAPFSFELICVSPTVAIDFHELVGEELTLRLLQADGSLRSWHGHLTATANLGADGGLVRYRLSLRPWLAWLDLRHDSRIFQDLDLRGICDAVFAAYGFAHWRFDVSQPLRQRSICAQHRETDLAFITRLLAEEGLSWYFEHDQHACAGDDSPHTRHTLVIFDRDAELPAGTQAQIRFHRADAPEADDTVQRLGDARRTAPNVLTLAGWDYKRLHATAAEAHSALDNGTQPELELFDAAGQYRFESDDAATLRTALALGAHEARYRRLRGHGRVRQLAAGTRIRIATHDTYDGTDDTFTVLSVEHRAANNLGAQAARLDDAEHIEPGTYHNHFMLQPAAIPVLPQPLPKPVVPAQSALVVGLPDTPLDTERDHRIRIQFHWQRGEQPNPGGLPAPEPHPHRAPGDHRCAAWVRVAEWLAGPDWGSHFLPRIGSEVQVAFDGGDIDRPLVVGSHYNGADPPPFAAGQDSAANHPGVLSGWHSHNHQDGFNQWVVDDAPAQLRTRLTAHPLRSELGLGHLIHHSPGSAQRGAWRGSGFELRTDGWAVLRAGEGLLLSGSTRAHGASTQLDIAEAVGQLHAAREAAERLSDAAAAHHARPLQANAEQRRFIAGLDPQDEGRYSGEPGGQPALKAQPGTRQHGDPTERFAQPVVLAEVPGDIGLNSRAATLIHATGHLHATVHNDAHFAAAHTWAAAVGHAASWFCHRGGIRAVAAAGPFSVHAHTDRAAARARTHITVTSSTDEIHIHAKDRIRIAAGSTDLVLQGGNITFRCPGKFCIKGAGHVFKARAKQTIALDQLPDSRVKLLDEGFIIRNQETGEPMVGVRYRIQRADGTWEPGVTDSEGRTHVVMAPETEQLKIELDP